MKENSMLVSAMPEANANNHQHDSDVDATMALPDSNISKQESDLAFAVVVVRSGVITERQLGRWLDEWTIYGNETLGDRLVAEKAITAQQRSSFASEATQRLRAAHATVDRTVSGKNDSHRTMAVFGVMDPSGRLCKLLGIANGSTIVAGEEGRRLFSRFLLIRKLGEGGLGTVWLARDENLRRYVAIKEIRASIVDESAAASVRFRREAEITGRLEHPGIVPIYQFGTDEQTGRFFYVMRFLGKQTMQDSITEYHERREAGNDEPLLMHRLLTSFVKLCNSVAHAHSRKVVHRDLKPENVALDNFGQVVLLDWGLAKINDETGAADAALEPDGNDVSEASLTMASQVLGSPMYMAPEQAAGRIDEIDERTDVYGLGGILYAILTGLAPHEHVRDSSANASMSDLLSAIVGGQEMQPRELVGSVPPELNAICVKAMEKKRYLRYSHASDIAEDVERYMAGDKVSAYRETYKERAFRWITAHPKISQLVGLIATFALLTIMAAGYSIRQSQLMRNAFLFQDAAGIAKELAFNLQSQTEQGISDARFLTGLPPVQALITARKRPEQVAEDPEDKEIWRERFSAIFQGLLQNNESYLAVIFLAMEDRVHQMIKLERNTGTGFIRGVPTSLLTDFPYQEDGPDFRAMMLGDVILQTNDKVNEDAPTQFRDALSLATITSVFDENSGEIFGLMVIQLDLRTLLKERIEAITHGDNNVYVTDGEGVIQLAYQDRRFVSTLKGNRIDGMLPELEAMFSKDSSQDDYSDGQSLYATRIHLGEKYSSSLADVAIVVEVD